MTKLSFFSLLAATPILLQACGSSIGATSTSTPITASMKLVESGVAATGSGMSGSHFANLLSKDENYAPFSLTALTSSLCDQHGTPQTPGGGGNLMNNDARFPYIHTYCALTINDGDTVRGGFSLVEGLVCSLEKGGIEFNGVPQTITITFSDRDCWPNGGPGGGTGSATITATGNSPAAFNAHYSKGVVFSVAAMGLTYSLGANLDSDKVEFIAEENWTGGDSNGNTGVMIGELTKSTGVLRFEKRDERIRADCANSSCGWTRHTRILANLTMSGGEPTNLNSFDYGYAGAWVSPAALADPTDTSSSGEIITAKGDLSSEIKARLFTANSKTPAQLKTVGQWSETANAACASSAGVNTAGDCGSETGIANFTADTKFALFSTAAQTSPANYLTTYTGFNFTNVNLDVDNAF